MALPLVYADFNNLDDSNRLKLDRAGTIAALSEMELQLAEGLPLTLYMDDADDEGRSDRLLAEGIVHFNREEGCWVAAIDWDAIRHESDIQNEAGTPAPAAGQLRP